MSAATYPDCFLPDDGHRTRSGRASAAYFHRGLKIEYKGDADLVTAADRASEVLIRERIRQQFPSHDVLGEEQGLSDQGGDYRWYVDPLDGTTNFAHGYPVFCVSMALEHRGKIRHAALQEWCTIPRATSCLRPR